MSLLFVLETGGAVLLICAIVIGILFWFAPQGSEDETGFHLSETNSPQEVKPARPNYGPRDEYFFSTTEFDSVTSEHVVCEQTIIKLTPKTDSNVFLVLSAPVLLACVFIVSTAFTGGSVTSGRRSPISSSEPSRVLLPLHRACSCLQASRPMQARRQCRSPDPER